MKTKWPTKKLAEVCEFQNGLWTGKKPPYKRVCVLRNANFKNNDGSLNYDDVAEIEVEEKQLEKRLLQPNDIILERSGGGPTQPVGRVVFFDKAGEYSFSNFTSRLRVFDTNELMPKFLHWFLMLQYISGKTENLQKQTTGIRNLIFAEYKEIEIPLPPLEEQKRIVKVLDEKLGKVREAIQLRKEAIADTEKILSAKLTEIFTEGKEKGWEERRIDEVAIINPKKSEISWVTDETQVAFVPMSAVSDTQQKIVDREMRSLGEVRKGYTYFKRGDLLFAKITPCMENGKVAVADIETEIGFGTTEFHVLRSIEAKSNIRFLYYILASKKFRLEAEKKMTGSAGQKRVPKDFIESYRITIPDLKTQEKIVKELDELSARVAELRALQDTQLADLKSLERAYLYEAFNGQLL